MFGASFNTDVDRSLDIGALGKANTADAKHATSRRTERLERTIQNEILPRLLVSHRVGAVPPSFVAAAVRHLSDADVTAFVAAIRGTDDGMAVQFVRDLIANGTPIDAIYVDLLSPAARRLGTLWDSDECDFIEVTVALGRMQRMLRDLSQAFLADSGRGAAVGNVLLTCVPGEQHTLGLIIVAEFLLRDGWQVLIGAPWTASDLMTLVASEFYDVIGFSVGCESRMSSLKREIRRLRAASRNPHVKVLVGGKVFIDEPEMVARVGADGYATDAREAPQVARALLAVTQSTASHQREREASQSHGELSETIRSE